MRMMMQHYRSGELEVVDVPAPALGAKGVIVATSASLVSAGTEKMLVDLAKASLIGKAYARPDLVRQVVDKAKREGIASTIKQVRHKLDNPIPLGYSCAGRVLEVGTEVAGLEVGRRVACGGAGYANHAEINYVPQNLCVPIPDGVDDEAAAFVTVGAIALQGVRQAAPTLGERFAVIGLGLIGQLTVQLLKANGCRVLGYDVDGAKAALALDLGADAATAEALAERADAFSDGRGVDGVIVAASTQSSEPIALAGEIARPKGRVVVVGMVGMTVPREPYYKKELDLRLSMSYGPGRYDANYEEKGQDYPFAHVRWTEQRNMQAFLELVAEGKVTPGRLITHRFEIAKAHEAYRLLGAEEPYIGIVLTYPEATEAELAPRRRLALTAAPRAARARHRVGVIGAGNHACAVLLPHVAKTAGVELTGVATATGLTSKRVGEKFGFAYCTTDYSQVIADPETDTVFIATRHDRHAAIALDALAAGKAVFVEKPLAVDRAELDRLVAAVADGGGSLMVGFNRRFAPLLVKAKAFVDDRTQPLMLVYRVNAGAVSAEHWVQQSEGAGRIVGEVCHFVDALQFVTGAAPRTVHAAKVAGPAGAENDALSVAINFADGSLGTIVYSSLGDTSYPKDYLEIFGRDLVVTITDYRRAEMVRGGRRRTLKPRAQDKGFRGELAAFFEALRAGAPMPIPFASMVATTETTFAIQESLARGAPVAVGPAGD